MNWSNVSVIAPPTAYPVTLAEAKSVLAVLHDDDDALIAGLIAAATDFIDGPNGVGVAMMAQTWRYALDNFPDRGDWEEIKLPGHGVTAVSSVTYVNTAGIETILDAAEYRLEANMEPARVYPVTSWPGADCRPGAVWVDYVLGAASPADVAEPLRVAVLHIVAHWFEHRNSVADVRMENVPMGAHAILEKYKRGMVAA